MSQPLLYEKNIRQFSALTGLKALWYFFHTELFWHISITNVASLLCRKNTCKMYYAFAYFWSNAVVRKDLHIKYKVHDLLSKNIKYRYMIWVRFFLCKTVALEILGARSKRIRNSVNIINNLHFWCPALRYILQYFLYVRFWICFCFGRFNVLVFNCLSLKLRYNIDIKYVTKISVLLLKYNYSMFYLNRENRVSKKVHFK